MTERGRAQPLVLERLRVLDPDREPVWSIGALETSEERRAFMAEYADALARELPQETLEMFSPEMVARMNVSYVLSSGAEDATQAQWAEILGDEPFRLREEFRAKYEGLIGQARGLLEELRQQRG